MKENSLIPNGFFLANNQEVATFTVGAIVPDCRLGVFPTLDLLCSKYNQTQHLQLHVDGYSVVAVHVSNAGIIDQSQTFGFKPCTATVTAVWDLTKTVEVCSLKQRQLQEQEA